MLNTSNITSGTIARTIVLVVALINQVLSATGHAVLPIEDAQIEAIVSNVFTIAAALVAWYKNNSITPAAQEADKVMQDLKQGREPGGSKGVAVEFESQKGVREDE